VGRVGEPEQAAPLPLHPTRSQPLKPGPMPACERAATL
jgi:hypothetical protein